MILCLDWLGFGDWIGGLACLSCHPRAFFCYAWLVSGVSFFGLHSLACRFVYVGGPENIMCLVSFLSWSSVLVSFLLYIYIMPAADGPNFVAGGF